MRPHLHPTHSHLKDFVLKKQIYTRITPTETFKEAIVLIAVQINILYYGREGVVNTLVNIATSLLRNAYAAGFSSQDACTP
jgi:hypothetical protein